jgi:hypothetical protein
MPAVSAPTLAQIAEGLEARARALWDEGKREAAWEVMGEVVKLLKAWGTARGLSDADPSGNLQQMTGAQLQRRGKAIAKGHAAKSKDRLWLAIIESKWGSQEVYAKKRLGVSPGSLSAYRSGDTPCPRPVADKVRKDFGIGDDYWKSIVD